MDLLLVIGTNNMNINDIPFDNSIEVMDVFVVYNNTDGTEGRGTEYVFGVYYTLSEAVKAAKGKYVMGNDCPVKNEKVLVATATDNSRYMISIIAKVCDKFVDPRELKKRALAKLTSEEKEILGLKG